MYIIYILAGLALFLLFLLLIPLRVVIEIDKGVDFFIKILFIKIQGSKGEKKPKESKSPKKIKTKKQNKSKQSAFDMVRKVLAVSDELKTLAALASRRCVVIEDLGLRLEFGTGDAAQTGIATGALNATAYSVLGVIHHNTTLKSWKLSINPDFDEEKFDCKFRCIVRTRLLHIISIGIRGLKLYLKLIKVK